MDDRRSGGDAGTEKDSDDQWKLRQVVAAEIEEVMHKHGVGGAVYVCSQDSAAWRFVIPKWSCLRFDSIGAMRFKGNTRTPEARAQVEGTVHFIAAVRDMSVAAGQMFHDLFRCVESALPPDSITRTRFQGFGVGRSGD